MGFFKKIFSDAADELKKNLEDAKKEMLSNLEEVKQDVMAGFTNSISNSRDYDEEDDEEPKILLGDFHDGVLTIREGITELDDESLEHYKRIRKIIFPASLERLDSNVIDDQERLEELDFSKVTKLKTIPDDFISGENKIRKLIIPNGVTEVGDGFLGEAKSGAEIFVPASVRKLGYITGNNDNDMTVYLFAANIDISDVEQDVKTLYVHPDYYGYYAKQLKECYSEANLREMPNDKMDIYREVSKGTPTEKIEESNQQKQNSAPAVDEAKPEEETKAEAKEEIEQKEEPIENGGLFSARLEAMISAALQDGVLTDKERELLKRRVEKEGEDWDEVEMIIEARLAEKNPVTVPASAPESESEPEPDGEQTENVNDKRYPEEYYKKMKLVEILPFIKRRLPDIESHTLRPRSKIDAFDYLNKLSEIVPETEMSVATFIACAEFFETVGFFDDPEAKIRELLQIEGILQNAEALKNREEQIKDYRRKLVDNLKNAKLSRDDSEQAEKELKEAVEKVKLADISIKEGAKSVEEIEQFVIKGLEKAAAEKVAAEKAAAEKAAAEKAAAEKAAAEKAAAEKAAAEKAAAEKAAAEKAAAEKAAAEMQALQIVQALQIEQMNRQMEKQAKAKEFDENGVWTVPETVYILSEEKVDEIVENKENLEAVILPKSLKEIGDNAFCDFSNLQIVDMSQCDSLEKIEHHAFYDCSNLQKVILPKSLKEIGEYAFCYCSNLQIVDVSQCDSLEKIGEGAFYECSSAEFAFPKEFESLKNIDFEAFYNCKKITSFPFSKALKKMKDDAFMDCSNLQILDFSKCTELWDINYRIIYEKGLDSLKKIILPPSQTMFNALCIWGPNVHIGEETNQAEVDISHCNFKWVNEEAFQTMDMKEIIIPDTVETIGENAFDECVNLKTIVMPAALKEIKAPLGSNLEQLKKVDFSKVTQLKVIPKNIFGDGCDKLKELMIPNGVTEIEDDAFECLGKLKRLFLPPTLESIGDLELTNFSIYCFSPSLEELEPIVYGWDDDDDEEWDEEDLEDLDEETLEELKEEKRRIKINLFVLPQYVEKYISQRNAERIPEDVLIIKEIPEEFRYYYDN